MEWRRGKTAGEESARPNGRSSADGMTGYTSPRGAGCGGGASPGGGDVEGGGAAMKGEEEGGRGTGDRTDQGFSEWPQNAPGKLTLLCVNRVLPPPPFTHMASPPTASAPLLKYSDIIYCRVCVHDRTARAPAPSLAHRCSVPMPRQLACVCV